MALLDLAAGIVKDVVSTWRFVRCKPVTLEAEETDEGCLREAWDDALAKEQLVGGAEGVEQSHALLSPDGCVGPASKCSGVNREAIAALDTPRCAVHGRACVTERMLSVVRGWAAAREFLKGFKIFHAIILMVVALLVVGNICLAISVGRGVVGALANVAPGRALDSGDGAVGAAFDCSAGGRHELWSYERQEWCCSHQGVGCPSFDCSADLSNWQVAWTTAKKTWCCSREGRGCGPGGSAPPSPAPLARPLRLTPAVRAVAEALGAEKPPAALRRGAVAIPQPAAARAEARAEAPPDAAEPSAAPWFGSRRFWCAVVVASSVTLLVALGVAAFTASSDAGAGSEVAELQADAALLSVGEPAPACHKEMRACLTAPPNSKTKCKEFVTTVAPETTVVVDTV